MKRLLFVSIFLCVLLPVFSQVRTNATWQAYIDEYKELAIEQMREYKIPASITLAQGLFESGAGQSRLARESNNHFGIKCHTDWTGKRTYHDDDKKDDCFRVYPSVRDSYIDHSKFLQRQRYKRLFDLDILDYKGWARGLKACGYATLPTYANRLIDVIEAYKLYEYDRRGVGKSKTKRSHIPSREVLVVNHRNVVLASAGDTWESLSKELKAQGIRISARRLRSYNEAPSKDFFPSPGTNIFLKKKDKHGDKDLYSKDYWHRIKDGESMYSIAQQYGIRLKYLYKMNFRDADYQPVAGDLLRVR